MKSENTDSAKRAVVIEEIRSGCRRDKGKVEAMSISAFILVSLHKAIG